MTTAPLESTYEEEASGTGWVAFAGTMLILVGCFNVIDGIAALANCDYLVNQLLFANLHAWGWFFLIWGAVQLCAGEPHAGRETPAILKPAIMCRPDMARVHGPCDVMHGPEPAKVSAKTPPSEPMYDRHRPVDGSYDGGNTIWNVST